MDFRKMIKDPKFSYLTEEEKEYLLMVYLPQRKSVFSKTNFLYLLGAFSSQLKKPLFEIRQQDAAAYTRFESQHRCFPDSGVITSPIVITDDRLC